MKKSVQLFAAMAAAACADIKVDDSDKHGHDGEFGINFLCPRLSA